MQTSAQQPVFFAKVYMNMKPLSSGVLESSVTQVVTALIGHTPVPPLPPLGLAAAGIDPHAILLALLGNEDLRGLFAADPATALPEGAKRKVEDDEDEDDDDEEDDDDDVADDEEEEDAEEEDEDLDEDEEEEDEDDDEDEEDDEFDDPDDDDDFDDDDDEDDFDDDE